MADRRADAIHAEDESYFISMTDLLVGILFIFIIILMAFALKLKDQEDKLDNVTERLTNAGEVRKDLLERLQKSLLDEGVTVAIDTQNGVLRLPEKVLFKQGDYELDVEGQDAIAKLANHLVAFLPGYACMQKDDGGVACPDSARLETIFIEGHTDNVPVGGALATKVGDNWGLSARRAISIYQKLVQVEPTLERFQIDDGSNGRADKLIGVSGYADRRPVNTADTPEGKAENRRIDLRFLMNSPDKSDTEAVQKQFDAAGQEAR